MRIKVANLMELVLILAFAMSVVRWSHTGARHPNVQIRYLVRGVMEPFLTGISLAGGIGLWWEIWRSGVPRVWGLGRWTLSIAAVYVILSVASHVTWYMQGALHVHGMAAWRWFFRYLRSSLLVPFSGHQGGWVFPAIWITSWIARPPQDIQPDFHEWLGRCLMATISLWMLVALGIECLR